LLTALVLPKRAEGPVDMPVLKVDLPGYDRNLSKVYLRCHSVGGYHVTIEIFARR